MRVPKIAESVEKVAKRLTRKKLTTKNRCTMLSIYYLKKTFSSTNAFYFDQFSDFRFIQTKCCQYVGRLKILSSAMAQKSHYADT
jgi:hypothetical protein